MQPCYPSSSIWCCRTWTGCSQRRSNPDSAEGTSSSTRRINQNELTGVESNPAAAMDMPTTPKSLIKFAVAVAAIVLGWRFRVALVRFATSAAAVNSNSNAVALGTVVTTTWLLARDPWSRFWRTSSFLNKLPRTEEEIVDHKAGHCGNQGGRLTAEENDKVFPAILP